PEFLGKKIRAPQMKLVVTYVLTIPIVVLVLVSISLVIGPGTSSILNPGFHGLTEVTYAYASSATNNGSAFAGLSANTPWNDTTLGLTMLVGRFAPIVLALAIAGSLAGARVHARTRATLDTTGPTFVVFLLGVIVIVGGLIYFPCSSSARSASAWSDERKACVLAPELDAADGQHHQRREQNRPVCVIWPAIPATRTAAPKFEAGHPGRPRLTVVV
ncbi:MAG TPA: potassium-transporting ATPase subunit KdpA, partial [Streptosporangiaceae bacterium]|nr:potassium-transporting ATPase subunit KdpA [Streptosporangiaceae bacterium]